MTCRRLRVLIESAKNLKFKCTVSSLQKHMKNKCSREPRKNLAWSRPYLVRAHSIRILMMRILLWKVDCNLEHWLTWSRIPKKLRIYLSTVHMHSWIIMRVDRTGMILLTLKIRISMRYWPPGKRRSFNIIRVSILFRSQYSMLQSMKEATICRMLMTLNSGIKSFPTIRLCQYQC